MGLGYEYELDGQILAKIKDAGDDLGKMSPTDFRGHTGTLELGANIKASKKIDINLSGQGFVGKRTGLAGMLKIKYAFCGFGKQANAQRSTSLATEHRCKVENGYLDYAQV